MAKSRSKSLAEIIFGDFDARICVGSSSERNRERAAKRRSKRKKSAIMLLLRAPERATNSKVFLV